jgi:choline dehydrogenase
VAAAIWDYIIVGAGSAGCVMANRLSASGRFSALLLEAGPRDSNPWIHIPLGYGKLFTDPRYNWMFESEPEPELNNRRIIQPRGKGLGGSSSINGLVHVRGQREDFDRWVSLGNRGWGYADVLPYFKKSEDFQHGAEAPAQHHGPAGDDAVRRGRVRAGPAGGERRGVAGIYSRQGFHHLPPELHLQNGQRCRCGGR